MVRYGNVPAWAIGLTPEQIAHYHATHEYVTVSPPAELIERALAFQREYQALCERYGATIDVVDYGDGVGVYIGEFPVLEREYGKDGAEVWQPRLTSEYALKADASRG